MSTARAASANDAGRVLVRNRPHRVQQQIAADEPEHRRDIVGRNRLARERDHLIELALRRRACCRRRRARSTAMHRRPPRSARRPRSAGAGSAMAFVLIVRNSYTCDRERTVSGIFSSSVVAIMKTTCGGGSSIDLSSALNEWLRQLVHFVDDEDLVAVAHRRNRQSGDDHLADVVDLRVRRCIDFEDVDVPPFGNLHARFAGAAGVGRGTARRSSTPSPGSAPSSSCRRRAVPRTRTPGRCGRSRAHCAASA